MKIDDAIKHLQEAKQNGNTDVIIGWYTKDAFDDNEVTDEEWGNLCYTCDDNLDWSNTYDAITDVLCEMRDDEAEED